MAPPPPNPYARFRGRQLTLNDQLAIDRTVLANQRTLLAYGRTALAMLIIGATTIQFFSILTVLIVGVPFLIGGVVIMVWGLTRYQHTRRNLSILSDRDTAPPDPEPSKI
ncbi:MAG: DUF202 domain-containing protein [Phycisphaerales bacterium]